MKTSIKYIPEFDGDYIHIYKPGGDIYNGVDTDSFKNRKDIESGYTTSPYTQYREYLETLQNIEEMIIDELRDCFMLVY